MFGEAKKCDKCKATYLVGAPHACDTGPSREEDYRRLEAYLGGFTIVHD